MKFKYVLPASMALVLPIMFSGCTSQTPGAVQSAPSTVSTSAAASAATPSPSATAIKIATAKPTTKSTPAATPKKTAASKVSAAKSTALKQLKSIVVAEANYSVKYVRTTDFGPAWYDYDHNGCDTRNDILKRDLTNIVYRADDPGCTIASGTLHDPYTGKTISFVRGPKSSIIEIDHLAPLHYIWLHGAYTWSSDKRLRYANDPQVLIAVDGTANEQKSDSGPADWLPRKAYQCAYVEHFTGIAHKYGISLSRRDDAKIKSVLATCS